MTAPATRNDLMIVNMGPQHPSMHGVLRLIVTLDGEDVIDCEPILGYLHRGMEKIAENRTIIQYLPYVTRWDYLATMLTEAITVNAPEQLGNIQVPKRAYVRVKSYSFAFVMAWPFYGRYWRTDPLLLYFSRKRIDI
ncbi:NAD(P)H-quinone oxidoreductase subunit H [Heracleum sosnowskyi]|uniref:NAD(P)H-quinone oxidoreductase subunit H n=1 Tax=Heracleum sosnowskyi TaxID=360622 RepID=A0AAD8JKF5_9APIA|nr:NAD(P)H-quinone oxidoreductase subunit H [Heracleum sosnowskyi]